MPSTYTLNNGIELIATGEQSGTWGDTTNTNLSLVDTALDGQVTVTLPSAGTSGSPNTLAISDGAASDGRNRMVIFNDGGDLGATAYVQLTPNDAEKIIYVRNDLAGSRSIILFQGTYNASNDYELPAGTTAVIYFDGAGSGAVAANVFNNAYFDSLRLGSVSVTEIIDDDTMATAAATNIATSESIKAYVDAQVGANNELSEVLANGNTSGGNAIQMTTTDELQFRDTALKISSSADGQLDIDADTEIEIVAPTVDIDASTAMTIDTAALTVTGAVDFNTSLNVDGTVTSDGLTVDGSVKLDGNYPDGSDNTALGSVALENATTGSVRNVALGKSALRTMTTADYNTGLGAFSLTAATSSANTAVGYDSISSATTGTGNTGLGYKVGEELVTGDYNVLLGYNAAPDLGIELTAGSFTIGINYTIATTGNTDFTLIGAADSNPGTTFTATGAGTGTGTATPNSDFNTIVGSSAGALMIGGSKNTVLGRFDGNEGGVDIRNSDNNIVLSDGDGTPRLAYVSANAELVINENGDNVDFRVEGNTNQNLFLVDGSQDQISMGADARYGSSTLTVHGGSNAVLALARSNVSGSDPTGNTGLWLGDTGSGTVFFARDKTSNNTADAVIYGEFGYNVQDERMRISRSYTSFDVDGGTTVAKFSQANNAFNLDSTDTDFIVRTPLNSHLFYVDSGTNSTNGMVKIRDSSLQTDSYFVANGQVELNVMENFQAEGTIYIGRTNGTLRYHTLVAKNDTLTGENYLKINIHTGTEDEVAESVAFKDNETLFNNSGASRNFRIAADTINDLFFVDVVNNRIGAGTNSLTGEVRLTVDGKGGAASGTSADTRDNASLRVSSTDATSGGLGTGTSMFLGIKDSTAAWIQSQHISDNGEKELLLNPAGGNVVVNDQQATGNSDFRVKGDTNASVLLVDAELNKVGVGSYPDDSATLDVTSRTFRAANTFQKYAQYAVPTATFVDTYWNDTTLDLNTGYVYRFQLTTVSTGTNTGVIYHAYYDDTNWQLITESLHNTSSNNPQGRISGGRFQVYHNHPSQYTISVHTSARAVGGDDNTDSSIGLPAFMTAYGTSGLQINPDSNSWFDTYIKSDNTSNMVFVDSDYDQVLFGTATTRANSSGLQKPHIVSGSSISGQSLDGGATFNTAAYQFGNSVGTTVTVQIEPGSGVYGLLEVHISGYNSSGSGATHALFHAGGHTGNTTLYNIQELYRYNYGNLTTSAATLSSGKLEFTVTTSGTGTGGLTTFTVKSMDTGAVVPRIIVT